jgi:glutamate dehydrogenase/leucine dehydrogenase
MKDAFQLADRFGPYRVVHIHRPSVGLKAIAVIDNTACGVAVGGVRMAPDVSLEECVRLARAMTWKNAAAGLPHGGGKSVIFGDPHMPAAQKESIVRAFADAIRDLSDYVPGPDMGTDELCMGWIKDETGRAVGLPSAVGGIPLDEIGATGFGLAACVDVSSRFVGLELKGARVVVQGFGAVGKHVARFLAEMGAILVGASDTSCTLVDAAGLDVAALIDRRYPVRHLDSRRTAGRRSGRQCRPPEGTSGAARREHSIDARGRADAACARSADRSRLHCQCRRRDLRINRIPRRDATGGIRLYR